MIEVSSFTPGLYKAKLTAKNFGFIPVFWHDGEIGQKDKYALFNELRNIS